MKAYVGVEVQLHSSYTRNYMEMSGQHHVTAALLPENNIDAHWIELWVGPWAGLDILESRKLFYLCWDSKPSALRS